MLSAYLRSEQQLLIGMDALRPNFSDRSRLEQRPKAENQPCGLRRIKGMAQKESFSVWKLPPTDSSYEHTQLTVSQYDLIAVGKTVFQGLELHKILRAYHAVAA